jgi:hypothetical protein
MRPAAGKELGVPRTRRETKMCLRNRVRKVVAACSLSLALVVFQAFAVIGFEAGAASASQGNFSDALLCELNGYMWSNTTNSCASKSCQWFGGTYYPGESTSMRTPNGTIFYYCDGLTGKMTPLTIKVSPTLQRLQPQGTLTYY